MDWRSVLHRVGALEALAGFGGKLVGTFPLGLDVPGSDLDIVCHARDAERFARHLMAHFGTCEGFSVWQWRTGERAVIASFHAGGVAFEIFGSPQRVQDQAGWRHFDVERRLLALAGEPLRRAVHQVRKRDGLKTEPAFAYVLGLAKDPYAALLDLQAREDGELRRVLGTAGFA